MIKLTVLYARLTDQDGFISHYRGTHAGLAQAIPGVQRFEYGPPLPGIDGSEPPYGWMAELWFEGPDALAAGLASPEGRAASEDLPNLVSKTAGPQTFFVSAIES